MNGIARDAGTRIVDGWMKYQRAIAFWVVAFLVLQWTFPAPVPILFLGMVVGSLSALVAMGLVLIYRANRIINFAQSQIGGVAAILAASLIAGPHWSYFPAVAVGFVFAVGLGALTELVFIRRFAKAPRLLLTVATIGIMELFGSLQLGMPKLLNFFAGVFGHKDLFKFDIVPQPPVPFTFKFHWDKAIFTGAHLLIIIVVPLVAVGLGAFFKVTRAGVAVRASAESADRAALLGIPVKRIGTLVWTMSAGLSALGVLLRMPIQGVNIGGLEGTSILMRALAAAVIARMESLPKAFGAALALGMVEQSVLYRTTSTIKVDGILLAVIIGALLFQRRGQESRADDTGTSSWAATKEVRPVPGELSRLPEVWVGRVLVYVVMFLVLVVIPWNMAPGRVNLMGVGLMMAIVTLSLVILTGWAGQISLGMVAFMAFGASVGGSLALGHWNFFLCILGAGLTGAVMAVLVGLPALRIRGLFLAVSTLAFALATGTFLLNNDFFTWLVPDPNKRIVRPILFNRIDLENERTFYFVILVFFLLALGSVQAMRKSRTGRILVATRDNQRAAQSYAVNPVRAKLTAFALSGFLAAVAGGLYVFHQHAMSTTILTPDSSILVFSMAVIGGLGSIPGALLGAVYLTFVNYSSFTHEPLSRLLASGVGVLVILMFIPGGLGSLLYSLRDNLLRVSARRRNIVVPSLLADVRVEDEEANILDEEADAENLPTQQIEHLSLPKDPLLTIRGINAGYGKTQVLFGVDMHVERGEMVALLGTNGAGKSTLLSVISGLLEPSAGSMLLDGEEIVGKTPQETLAAGVVFMPGGKGVFPTLTVEENFKLAAWQFEKDRDYVNAVFDRCL
ncbi:MAG TPA: ATP-binding cassette domain-containing protein, partial [Acidimicrobiales bacterium]|nr:ATP-binding cassette domain-containing protein [Acidimicrobiales bacterium]